MLSCSQTAEGSHVPAAAASKAGKMIGWKMTVFDGKGDPATYAEGVRSAIAAKADGIILVREPPAPRPSRQVLRR